MRIFDKLKFKRDDDSAGAPNEAALISRPRKALRLAGIFLAGALFSMVFPPLDWTFLSWIGLVPLFLFVLWKRPGEAWLAGFVWGYGWSVTSFFWLREIEPFVPFLLALVLGLFPAFWAWAVPFLFKHMLVPLDTQLAGCAEERKFRAFNPAAEIFFAVALAAWWCVIEWVRSWIGTGLPWNLLAATQWRNLPVIQICEFTGVYGVSFIVALINISLGMAWLRWSRAWQSGGYKRPWSLIFAVIVIMAAVVTGSKSLLKVTRASAETVSLSAAVLQGNIPQCRRASDGQAQFALEKYLSLSETAVIPKPDIVIWPETAVPYPYRGDHPLCLLYRCRLAELAQKSGVPFLIGTIDFENLPRSSVREPNIYNSAMLVGTDGKPKDRYLKNHIVPFGEFVPFSKYFPKFVEWVGMGRNLSRGGLFNPVEIKPGVRAGIGICFEDVFPYVSRYEALSGANMLLVITNDAWYPKSSEPEQHLANSIFRAVETRLPMLRCGNNSGSCVIQPSGNISDCIFVEPGETGPDGKVSGRKLLTNKKGEGWAVFTIEPKTEPPLTFYTRFGDVFIIFCGVVTGLALTLSLWRWRWKSARLAALFAPPGEEEPRANKY
jgi:apolipoprotein N-acyltransferase